MPVVPWSALIPGGTVFVLIDGIVAMRLEVARTTASIFSSSSFLLSSMELSNKQRRNDEINDKVAPCNLPPFSMKFSKVQKRNIGEMASQPGESFSPTKLPPVVKHKTMTQIPEIPEGSCDSIKIGTVGTIGSLMSQELDSMNSNQAASPSQKKILTSPPSPPCADTSKRTQPSKILSNEASGSNNHNAHQLSNAQNPKQKPLRNGQRAPILTSEAPHTDKKTRNKLNKKGHIYIVEVVDIKCNNPMSTRLKKLGFTKLSETIG